MYIYIYMYIHIAIYIYTYIYIHIKSQEEITRSRGGTLTEFIAGRTADLQNPRHREMSAAKRDNDNEAGGLLNRWMYLLNSLLCYCYWVVPSFKRACKDVADMNLKVEARFLSICPSSLAFSRAVAREGDTSPASSNEPRACYNTCC